MVVAAATQQAFLWIEARTGCVLTRNARAIAATDASGKVRGVIAYDCWTTNSVQAHMAVDTPVAWRVLLRPAFAYPFLECGKGVLLGIIQDSNGKSWHMAERLGFSLHSRIRDGWARGEDLRIYQMRREHCRWLPEMTGASRDNTLRVTQGV